MAFAWQSNFTDAHSLANFSLAKREVEKGRELYWRFEEISALVYLHKVAYSKMQDAALLAVEENGNVQEFLRYCGQSLRCYENWITERDNNYASQIVRWFEFLPQAHVVGARGYNHLLTLEPALRNRGVELEPLIEESGGSGIRSPFNELVLIRRQVAARDYPHPTDDETLECERLWFLQLHWAWGKSTDEFEPPKKLLEIPMSSIEPWVQQIVSKCPSLGLERAKALTRYQFADCWATD